MPSRGVLGPEHQDVGAAPLGVRKARPPGAHIGVDRIQLQTRGFGEISQDERRQGAHVALQPGAVGQAQGEVDVDQAEAGIEQALVARRRGGGQAGRGQGRAGGRDPRAQVGELAAPGGVGVEPFHRRAQGRPDRAGRVAVGLEDLVGGWNLADAAGLAAVADHHVLEAHDHHRVGSGVEPLLGVAIDADGVVVELLERIRRGLGVGHGRGSGGDEEGQGDPAQAAPVPECESAGDHAEPARPAARTMRDQAAISSARAVPNSSGVVTWIAAPREASSA